VAKLFLEAVGADALVHGDLQDILRHDAVDSVAVGALGHADLLGGLDGDQVLFSLFLNLVN
jgi:hypothetical protein